VVGLGPIGVRPDRQRCDPGWGAAFQVRLLSSHGTSLRGTFRSAQPFHDLEDAEHG
jgi:hypothetical protein